MLAAIAGGGLAADQLAFAETLQDAAQIAGIESQVRGEFGRGGPFAMRQLVEDAELGQRKRAVEEPFAQDSDLPGVETIEAAHGLDAAGDWGHGITSRGIIVARVN